MLNHWQSKIWYVFFNPCYIKHALCAQNTLDYKNTFQIQTNVKNIGASDIVRTTTYGILAQHPIYGKFFKDSNIENITKVLINSTKGINSNSFKRDAAQIMICIQKDKPSYGINSEQKLKFDTFLFDLDYHNTKLYKKEFLLFDFMVFFVAETHSDRILNPNSDYAYNQIYKLLNILENHHKNILNQKRYFNLFLSDVIQLCLRLRVKYAAKTDVFQKIFRLLINFIRKHKCKLGQKIPVYGNDIFQCILANHFYCDETRIVLYFNDYFDWIQHQLGRSSRYRLDGKEFEKLETAREHQLSKVAIRRFSHLCDAAALFADNSEGGLYSDENSKQHFVHRTRSWMQQVMNLATFQWYPRENNSINNCIDDSTIHRDKIFEAMFFGRIVNLEKCSLVHAMNLDILNNENDNNNYNSTHIGDIWKIGCDTLREYNIICFHHFLSEFVCFCGNPKNFTIHSNKNQINSKNNNRNDDNGSKFNNYNYSHCHPNDDNKSRICMFELDKVKAFNYLFDLFSDSYRGGIGTIIRSITSNCKDISTIHWCSDNIQSATRSIPPPKIIKLWIKWWIERSSQAGQKDDEYLNIFSSLDNLTTIESFAKCDINDRYNFINCKTAVQNDDYNWISGRNEESCVHHWYSLNYFVCNIWEDWLQQRERERYSKFKPFIQRGIPNEIISIILSYKNSIVIDDATCTGFGDQIRIDTYGDAFENFPKILNWSLEEQNYHLNYARNMDQDVGNCWIEYFSNKKKFLLVDSKQVSNQTTNLERSMKNVINELVVGQTVRSSSFINLKNTSTKPLIGSN